MDRWVNSRLGPNDGGPYRIELICRASQWTGFYMIGPPL